MWPEWNLHHCTKFYPSKCTPHHDAFFFCFFFVAGWYMQVVYQLFLAIYIVEVILRVYALRVKFFMSWWDDFSKWVVINWWSTIILIADTRFAPCCNRSGRVVCPSRHAKCWNIWCEDIWSSKSIKNYKGSEGIEGATDHQVTQLATRCVLYLIPIMCRFLKNLNVIVLTLLESIPAIGAIVITISLVLCEL